MSDTISRLNEALSGRYAVERDLGEGGMATVYLASDLTGGEDANEDAALTARTLTHGPGTGKHS